MLMWPRVTGSRLLTKRSTTVQRNQPLLNVKPLLCLSEPGNTKET